MRLNAFAKINFNLKILGKRADHFHALDSVMVGIGLHDVLVLEPASNFELTCSDPSLPCDDRNLVTRAARLLAKEAGHEPGIKLHLEKHVPMGGGLGGGSSDAACALVGLNEFWSLKFPKERLAGLAAQLGSDIAFFLWGGWCRCEGRGELITPLPEVTVHPRIFLIIPPWSVPTPPVYKALNAGSVDLSKAARPHTAVTRELNETLARIAQPDFKFDWRDNELTLAAQAVEPRLKELAAALEQLQPGRWRMSGSGAVHFSLPALGERPEPLAEKLTQRLSTPIRVIETTTR